MHPVQPVHIDGHKPGPNFTVKKTDVPGTGKPVVPGSKIPYTVTVKNIGSGAGSAVLNDPLPPTWPSWPQP